MSVKLVNDATALLSLRDSDFDAYSAFGEVVDNSIQAKATSVRIQFEHIPSKSRSRYRILRSLAFGDNGVGMNSETLHRCLQLGYSTRYNDRSGIGRFGVGVTLGAISQCKRFELYSKEKNGEWLYTYTDIDEITSNPPEMESIPEPQPKTLPEKYENLVGEESGTLVIWSKYDRQPCSAEELIEETRAWMGRTYRKFIWENLGIEIDGQGVFAIDPLYITAEKTKFPKDPPAYEYEPILLDWPIPIEDRSQNRSDKSNITIKMSLIDASLRPYQGVGASKETKERYIHLNEGVSILRNGREVFYGHIPYWKPAFEQIDRWWGCEISFGAELDKCFKVRNIKKGAVPVPELKEAIAAKIVPTIKTARETVSDYWKRVEQEKKEKERAAIQEDGLYTGHEEAERIAKETPTDKSQIDKHKSVSEESKRIVEELKNNESAEQRAKWAVKFASQPFTIIDKSWKGPNFFDIDHLGGSDVITYNSRHGFIEELYSIISALEENANGKMELAMKLKKLIDLLIMSYSKAEANFDANMEWTAEDFLEDLRINWGHYLNSYLRTWKKSEQ